MKRYMHTARIERRSTIEAGSAFAQRSARWLAAVVSGVLLSAAQSLEPVWWAAWLAPVPVLLAVFRASLREAWLLASIAGLIGVTSLARYYLVVIGPGIGAVYLVLRAGSWAAIVVLTRSVVRRSRHWAVVFAYPLAATALVTLVAAGFGGAPYVALAYSQLDALPAVQVASLVGVAGIDFMLSLFASLLAVAWHHRDRLEQPWLGYGLAGGAVVATLVFGAGRLALAIDPPLLQVALAAMDRTPSEIRSPSDADAPLWTAYGDVMAKHAHAEPRIVVLPEKLASVRARDVGAVQKRLGDMAAAHSVYLVAALDVLGAAHKENRAWMFAPSGGLVVDYLKHHLVPGWEADFVPGRSYEVRSIAGRRIGIAICRDMDYPDLSRRYAVEGVDALIVPAADFRMDAWWHGRIAVLRGIESGFAVMRSAQFGTLTVSDRYGRVRGERRSATDVVAVLAAAAPVDGRTTFYARFGDWFGWSCVGSTLAGLVWLVSHLRDRKTSDGRRAGPVR